MLQVKMFTVGEIETNCYLLFAPDSRDAAVIDPGGDSEIILRAIKDFSLKLKYIINTHFHFDHVLANEAIKAATSAKILIHENEKTYLNFVPDQWLRAGDKIKIGADEIEVLLTPGHTPGSICLLGDDFIFTGDTLFKDGYGRTDLPGGSEADIGLSLVRLQKIIKPGMKVYPGHGKEYVA